MTATAIRPAGSPTDGALSHRQILTILSGLMLGMFLAALDQTIVSTAIKTETDELLPPFERANGHTIRASYAPSGALIPRFERGEPVDVFLTDSKAIDELIGRGKIVPGRVDLARTGIGICVRKGAPRPNVSTPQALRHALLAAKSGASYISPFVGRLDDIGTDGMKLIADIVQIYRAYESIATEVLVASVRHPIHIIEAAKLGAHVATMPPSVLRQMFNHPLTDKGLSAFLADWAKTGQKIL